MSEGHMQHGAFLTTAGVPKRVITVRDATEADMDAVQVIYADDVSHGLASFDEVPPTVSEMLARRAKVLELGLPYLVAENDGHPIGFSYAMTYRLRTAYRYTIEDSVYVADGNRGRGIGRALLTALITRCEAGPWRQMIAIIGNSSNWASIALHEALGFRKVGTFQAVGFKLGRWVDSVLMQRHLASGSTALPDDIGRS
jgi:L-amino acid N-acyltransferase YncA